MEKTIMRITTVPMAFKVLLSNQIKFMNAHGFNVIMVSSFGNEREDIIRNEGSRHIVVPMTRKITPFLDLFSLLKLQKLMKKYKPDIVHTHTPKAGLLGMLAAKSTGIKVRIHTVAGLPLMVENGLKKQLLLATEKLTYKNATEIWPNSNSLKNYIKENSLAKEEKIILIGSGSTNGVNLEKFSEKNLDEKIKNDIGNSINLANEIKLLFVGRMVKDKGIEELIIAFKRLRDRYNVRLILVGPFEQDLDPLSENTMHSIRENPCISHISWSDSIEYYMALCDILIHPSHREGFPNVILQAGAMKLPVICSDIPGNTDIVKNNETALIFRTGDVDELYNAVSSAIENTEQKNKIALALYDEVVQLYDQKKIHNLILNRYNFLLKQYANK